MSDPARLLALLGVVYARPPEGTLQRGLVTLPRWPVVTATLLAIVAVAALSIARRRRR